MAYTDTRRRIRCTRRRIDWTLVMVALAGGYLVARIAPALFGGIQ